VEPVVSDEGIPTERVAQSQL